MSDPPPPIFSSQANILLARQPHSTYVEEWSEIFAKERTIVHGQNVQSVVLFRLGQEWLALSTLVLLEVAEMRLIRRIPHRSGDMLKGLINLRGQLCICINLLNFLEISAAPQHSSHARQKMVAISQDQQRWVFVADEVLGLFSCDKDTLKNVPVTVAKSTANYIKGTFNAAGKHVFLLDEELLFCSLERKMV